MFNYQEALKSGASEDQIIEYLTKTRNYDVNGALQAGASKQQVIEYLASTDKVSANTTQQVEKTQQPKKKKSFIEKVSDFGATVTGAKAASKLLSPIFSSIAVANPATPDKVKQNILLGRGDELLNKAQDEGLGAATKDVAGSSLELFASLAPFATGGLGLASKLPTSKLATEVSTKFPNITRYLGYGARGASYGGAFGVSNALQENKGVVDTTKEGLQSAAIGGAVAIAIPMAVEGTVRAVKNISTLYSGVPKDALENAFKNPEQVKNAIQKYAKDPENTKTVLNKANKSLSTIKQARTDNYKANLKALEKDIKITKTGPNAGRMYIKNPKTGVFEPTKLTTKGVKSTLTKTLKDYNLKVLNKSEQNQIKELQKLVSDWDDFTPKGIDDLRMAIRNRRLATNSKYLNGIYAKMEGNVRNYVNSRVPQIQAMNEQYAKESEFIESLQKEIFGKTSNMSDSTKLNKLLGIFKQNTDLRRKLVDELGKQSGQDLLNEINGVVLSDWLPQNFVQRFVLAGSGLAGGAGLLAGATSIAPTLAGTLPLASPRVGGYTAATLGQLNKGTPFVKQYGLPALINSIINK